jgi:ABC-2 type transport system ATP-binding protein
MTDLAVQTRGLVRAFGSVRAVAGIDLEVPRGCFYGFLGPNGAGKSTTIKMLTGLLGPTEGDATILGLDLRRDLLQIKRRIGVVPEGLALFDRLTGRENLTFIGRVFELDRATIRSRIGELLALMDLVADADKLVADYSAGMKKKISVAAALIHNPPLYFMDEPFEGIDAVVSRQIRDVLKAVVASGATVFLTSHVLEIVDKLCSHVGIIDHGRMVAQGPVEGMRGEGKTLEEIFFGVVGGGRGDAALLSWLDRKAP